MADHAHAVRKPRPAPHAPPAQRAGLRHPASGRHGLSEAANALNARPALVAQRALAARLSEAAPVARAGLPVQRPLQRKPRSIVRAPGDAPVQAVFIIRNGEKVWEPDPLYKLKKGETFANDFNQQPQILLDSGSTMVSFDKQGTQSKSDFDEEIPKHKELQKRRGEQGEEFAELIGKEKPEKIKELYKHLKLVSTRLEKEAGKSVPGNHKEKVRNLYDSGVTGKGFRAIIPGQDEFTQSQATSHFIKGFAKGVKGHKHEEVLNKYGTGMLRVMSSLRGPTQSILAPIEIDKKTMGQQHPTSKDQPKIEKGQSSHSYSDRSRVHAQNEMFHSLMNTENVPLNHIFLGTNLRAVTATLSTMSAPTSSKNLPRFNEEREETQVNEREQIKKQANIIANEIGVKTNTRKQAFDSDFAQQDHPTSPIRVPNEEMSDEDESSRDDGKSDIDEFEDFYAQISPSSKNSTVSINQPLDKKKIPVVQKLIGKAPRKKKLKELLEDDPPKNVKNKRVKKNVRKKKSKLKFRGFGNEN